MLKSQLIEHIQNRSERVYYQGNLLDYHLYPELKIKPKKEQRKFYHRTPYSRVQNALYKRALYGLTAFSEEDLSSMHPEKKKRIVKASIKVQKELLAWKHVLVNQKTNIIFEIFPNSPLAKALFKENSFTSNKVRSRLNLKEFGINKADIIRRLLSKGLLPANFHQLK